MTDDRYLWDRTGPRDPFVARLERELASKRQSLATPRRRRTPRLVTSVVLAAAALVVWACLLRQPTDGQPTDRAGNGEQPTPALAVDAEPSTAPAENVGDAATAPTADDVSAEPQLPGGDGAAATDR